MQPLVDNIFASSHSNNNFAEGKIHPPELAEQRAAEKSIPGQTVSFSFVFPSLFVPKCGVSA